MCHGIGPWLGSALIIGMPQQTRCGVVQVLVINQQLVCHFIVRRCAISKHLPIAREKRKRHENTVGPQLPLPALCVGMPKAAVFGSGIGIENFSNVVRGKFVFLLLRFFIKDQQEISRQHVVQRIDRSIDSALVIYVKIDPRSNVIEILWVLRSEIHKIDTIQIK